MYLTKAEQEALAAIKHGTGKIQSELIRETISLILPLSDMCLIIKDEIKAMKNSVIYPGTFDPITLGHEDLVKRAAQLFDRIIIAVGMNEQKKPLFSLEKRMDFIHQVFKDFPQVEIETFDGLLIDFAKTKGVNAILRGLRVVSDFDYEFQMASMNRALVPDIETIFLTPADRYTYISSSLVRVVIENGGDVTQFVPPVVAEAI